MVEASKVLVCYRRNLVAGATFFFTVALADRGSSSLIDYVDVLRFAFRKARSERAFDIVAIVILPDHLHAIFTLPGGDVDFPHRWRRIKTLFTKGVLHAGEALAQRDGTGRSLWQRRSWEHTIMDDANLCSHIDYIHYNPVKHGYVAQPADWPHSSLHRFIRVGVVAPDWGNSPLALDDAGEPKWKDA